MFFYNIPKNLARVYRTWDLNAVRIYGIPTLYLIPEWNDLKEDLYGAFTGQFDVFNHKDSAMSYALKKTVYAALMPTFYSFGGDLEARPASPSPRMWQDQANILIHVEIFREAFGGIISGIDVRIPQPGDLLYFPSIDEQGWFADDGSIPVESSDHILPLDGNRFYKIFSVERYRREIYDTYDTTVVIAKAQHIPIKTVRLSREDTAPLYSLIFEAAEEYIPPEGPGGSG